MKQHVKEETISFPEEKKIDILSKIMTEFSSGFEEGSKESPLPKTSNLKFSLYDHYLPKLEDYVRSEIQKNSKVI